MLVLRQLAANPLARAIAVAVLTVLVDELSERKRRRR